MEYSKARKAFVQGNLIAAQNLAHEGFESFQTSNPAWAWKFRILEAEALLWRGIYPRVLPVLETIPIAHIDRDSAIKTLALQAAALARMYEYQTASDKLADARRLCSANPELACGEVSRAAGVLANQREDIGGAAQLFRESLAFAQAHDDKLLETTDLLNIGAICLRQEHFDEAVEWSEAAYRSASALNASDLEQNALGNLGWAYYKLGDSEQALRSFVDAESRSILVGDVIDRLSWAMDAGYVYSDLQQFSKAEESYERALDLAQKSKARADVYNAFRALARLSVQTGALEKANHYAEQALRTARESKSPADELYPMLIQGEVLEHRGNTLEALHVLNAVERNAACPLFLKWEVRHALARANENGDTSEADRNYRGALSLLEAARADIRREDFQVSFLTNAAGIYDDYIHFLISQHKPDLALRWADFSRARALAEGLGMLRSEKRSATDAYITAPPLDPQAIARRAQGALLFYWLGEKQSHLWAITSHKAQLFPLPPRNEVETVVKRYRAALTGPQNVLESGGEDGQALYRMLIAPAQSLLAANERVFILPDGALNNLNFETLIVSAPKPHFWIEDADIVNASSLRVLDASMARPISKSKDLLLIGNSVSPGKDYPELPKAADQMAGVAHHFPSNTERVFEREQATPVSYLQTNLQQFSYIHFVAHGTASRLSPLDSAIVLSKDPANPESFKLYARDIIHHPLHAELVTISACYGAGERQYSGEGLVGLAWAFLRAGARNVIAALWEVTDVSTDQLMDRFYDELSKGAPPDIALRNAKLSLLHSNAFRNPFYWAPFQLYRG